MLSLGHLVTDIYQGALPATLPFLKEKLALSYTMTGFILMMANFTSSILQPLFGFYSDKKAKAILLPIGLLCAGVGFSFIPYPIVILSSWSWWGSVGSVSPHTIPKVTRRQIFSPVKRVSPAWLYFLSAVTLVFHLARSSPSISFSFWGFLLSRLLCSHRLL